MLILSYSPQSKEELFNLRHTHARNVIERAFGIIKLRFCILERPPSYLLLVQVRIFPALAAVHNFICIHDEEDVENLIDEVEQDARRNHSRPDPVLDVYEAYGSLGSGPSRPAERRAVMERQDHIAQQMWDDYREQVRRREIDGFENRV